MSDAFWSVVFVVVFFGSIGYLLYSSVIGLARPKITCPRCRQVGQVRSYRVSQKAGTSCLKVLLAFFTCGLSIVLTGLAQHNTAYVSRCSNCKGTF